MKLCKHCRWSQMRFPVTRGKARLYCTHPAHYGWCTDACDQWERDPGIDDDITEPRAQA